MSLRDLESVLSNSLDRGRGNVQKRLYRQMIDASTRFHFGR
jgi:hypothetical protein